MAAVVRANSNNKAQGRLPGWWRSSSCTRIFQRGGLLRLHGPCRVAPSPMCRSWSSHSVTAGEIRYGHHGFIPPTWVFRLHPAFVTSSRVYYDRFPNQCRHRRAHPTSCSSCSTMPGAGSSAPLAAGHLPAAGECLSPRLEPDPGGVARAGPTIPGPLRPRTLASGTGAADTIPAGAGAAPGRVLCWPSPQPTPGTPCPTIPGKCPENTRKMPGKRQVCGPGWRYIPRVIRPTAGRPWRARSPCMAQWHVAGGYAVGLL